MISLGKSRLGTPYRVSPRENTATLACNLYAITQLTICELI